MPSFFVVCGDSCAAQAVPVLFGAAAGLLWLTWDRERQGEAGALLPGTVRSSLPAAVSRYFRLWNDRPFSHSCCSRQRGGCSSSHGTGPPCSIPLPSTPGHVSPILDTPQGTCGGTSVNKKRPPARSRWPWISRREAAAYSPATAFWCSAMTLSATGWGASS